MNPSITRVCRCVPPSRHERRFSPDCGRDFTAPPYATQLYSNKPCKPTPLPWPFVQAMAGVAFPAGKQRLAIALLLQFSFFSCVLLKLTAESPREETCSACVPDTSWWHCPTPNQVGAGRKVFHSLTFFCASHFLSGWHRGSPTPLSLTPRCKFFGQDSRSSSSSWASQKARFCLLWLKRGGAAFHWQTSQNFEATMLMGRWADQKNCHIYHDDACALLVQQQPLVSSLLHLLFFMQQPMPAHACAEA